MFGWLTSTMKPDPAMLDHLPLNADQAAQPEAKTTAPGEGLSHKEKLALAAKRAGKAFRCAADGLPREVIKDGAAVTVGVPPAPVPEPPPNVMAIGRKGRA